MLWRVKEVQRFVPHFLHSPYSTGDFDIRKSAIKSWPGHRQVGDAIPESWSGITRQRFGWPQSKTLCTRQPEAVAETGALPIGYAVVPGDADGR
jgi:hypothetical protein